MREKVVDSLPVPPHPHIEILESDDRTLGDHGYGAVKLTCESSHSRGALNARDGVWVG